MKRLTVKYVGDLRCQVEKCEGATLSFITDAPIEYGGKGAAFSPTDTVAAALASCMLTLIAIVACKQKIDINGSFVDVSKEMTVTSQRRIGKLILNFQMTAGIPVSKRKVLEKAVCSCPVRNSLHPDIKYQINFNYLDKDV